MTERIGAQELRELEMREVGNRLLDAEKRANMLKPARTCPGEQSAEVLAHYCALGQMRDGHLDRDSDARSSRR
jgi:hypothetical protein